MRSTIVIASILVSLQFLGCHGAGPNARLSFFDIDLLRYTAAGKKGNVMVSPASIKSTLAMILEGARGKTAAEVKSALRVSPLNDDFREELMVFLKALQTKTKNISLDTANAIFISKKLQIYKEYDMVLERMYKSEVGKLDFHNAKYSADTINGWVKDRTRGLIPSIIEEVQIPPTADMLIMNALYFKAPWKLAFDPKATHSDCFYNNDVCRNVAMMDIQSCINYAYVEQLRAHAFELPYQGGRYSMIVLMPIDRDGSEDLIRDLPYYSLSQIAKNMYITDLVLTMPKFSVDYDDNMVEPLRSIGITSLFSKAANLSGIFDSGDSPFINSMYHSVHMTVNEEGTEAAAATAGFVVPLINNKVQLRVDRPFLFFIKDTKLDVILFEGKIEEPTEFVETPKVQPQVPVKEEQIPNRSFSDQTKQNTSQSTFNEEQPTNNPANPSQSNLNREIQPANKQVANHSTSDKPSQARPAHSNQDYHTQFNLNQENLHSPSNVVSNHPTTHKPKQNQPNEYHQHYPDNLYSNQENSYQPSNEKVPNLSTQSNLNQATHSSNPHQVSTLTGSDIKAQPQVPVMGEKIPNRSFSDQAKQNTSQSTFNEAQPTNNPAHPSQSNLSRESQTANKQLPNHSTSDNSSQDRPVHSNQDNHTQLNLNQENLHSPSNVVPNLSTPYQSNPNQASHSSNPHQVSTLTNSDIKGHKEKDGILYAIRRTFGSFAFF